MIGSSVFWIKCACLGASKYLNLHLKLSFPAICSMQNYKIFFQSDSVIVALLVVLQRVNFYKIIFYNATLKSLFKPNAVLVTKHTENASHEFRFGMMMGNHKHMKVTWMKFSRSLLDNQQSNQISRSWYWTNNLETLHGDRVQ